MQVESLRQVKTFFLFLSVLHGVWLDICGLVILQKCLLKMWEKIGIR